jgi:iron-sulfur cluster assembly protein/iron-sulfur cluster insertion protein
MITLTERAAKQVELLQKDLGKEGEGKHLRLSVESGGCSGFQYNMYFDEPVNADTVVESEGVQIILDPSSLIYLKGSVVDFNDGLGGKGFDIQNPNAKDSCGCGRSFS